MSFQQGLSGLNAAAKNLDVIGNNVANSGTVGFKQSQAQFADVYANSLTGTGGSQIGIGVQLATVAQQFTQGNITATNNPLDIAINGGGFFRMESNGGITYQRNGQFQLDRNGFIVGPGGANLTGYTANASGVLSTGAPAPLFISTTSLPPRQSAEVLAQLTLDSTKSTLPATGFNQNDPTTFHNSTSVSIFDSLGNSHTLQTYYVKTGAGSWNVFGSLNGATAGPVGTLTFNSDGALTTPMPLSTSVTVITGATSPFSIDLDFSGTTQYGAPFSVDRLVQDGYTSGRLAGFSIADDGTILGRYTNGESNVLGQVILASFANPNGLKPIGNNMWAETAQSGPPLVGTPSSGNLGVLQSSAVEDSNVDLTAELVNMITAQRVYQANAQTIKAQDAVMQTLVNLR